MYVLDINVQLALYLLVFVVCNALYADYLV